MIDAPLEFERGEGLYEWRTGKAGDKGVMVDIIDLKKDLEKIPKFKESAEKILDRLQNFRICYLNKSTGEVST